MKKLSIVLCLCLILAGCSQNGMNQTSTLLNDEYSAILPFDPSNARGKHAAMIKDVDTRDEVETGLMDLSKQYFSVNDVGYKVHVFLDYDELDATDMSRGLLGTLRDNNPNGLNPNSEEDFDTGNGIVKGPVLVMDLYELDFYAKDQLKGISIGLVVPDAVSYEGQEYEIAPEKMQAYLEVTCTKLASYLRERFNEISMQIPILIAAYQLNTDSTDAVKGGYIYSVWFNGASTDYQTIDEQHYIVPGSAFSAADPVLASEFAQFKSDIASILPDNTFVSGEAKFENGKCDELALTVETHGKTAGETLACIQSIRDNLSVFTSSDMQIKITVKNSEKVYALMYRPKGTYQTQVITTL